MADIAILVAEEYERRLNRERRNSAAVASERKVDHVHLVEINANWESAAAAAAENLRSKMVEMLKTTKKVLVEPKSQVSLAASTGFFSA
ncbi:unnamed protein product [Linum trigynum]|uniref:Uncharacterized protein n=1 Tax=Linum trigynum TaxID=586398 RepID=A0AAV2E3H2_9ROSI